MITIKKAYDGKNIKENQIVLDIETTGLDSFSDKLVLLGLIYKIKDKTYIEQIFAENDLEEAKLLKILKNRLENKTIITYNGDTFDLPFLNKRFEENKISQVFFEKSIDLYKIIKSKRIFIDYDSMKLVDIEKKIGINRLDPSRYKVISKLKDNQKKRENPLPIIIHNRNDLIATEKLININDIFREKLSITYKDNLFWLENAYINNDIGNFSFFCKKKLSYSYFFNDFYEIKIKDNKIELSTSVLYGNLSEKNKGYVTINRYNIKNISKLKVNEKLLIIKEDKVFNYKNILALLVEILKENINKP